MKNILNIRRRGFTLIELLIVISIIGVLTGVIVPNFMGVRERARDVERKSDLKALQQGLELYKMNANPPSYPANINRTCGQPWTNNDGTYRYMTEFPCDPLTNTTRYIYTRSTNLTYTLSACLENRADADGTVDCRTANGGLGLLYSLTEP